MRQIMIFLLALCGQAAHAQDDKPGIFDKFIGYGTDFGAGHVSQTDQPDIWGRKVGLGGAVRLGGDDDSPLFLEFGWSHLNGHTHSQSTQSLATGTPFVFATRVSPDGDLSLNTLTDDTGAYATSIVTLTDAAGNDTNITSTTYSPQGGQTSVYAYSPTDTGGLFTSVITDGTGGIASAVGFIFDETGAVMMADGNGGETQVTTERRDEVDFVDGSVQLSTVVPLDNGWNFIPRGGLVLQSFERSTILTQTMDVDDGFAVDVPTPDMSIIQNTDLHTDMTGLSAGMGFSRQISDRWNVSFGADIGAMRGKSRYTSHELVQRDALQVQNIAGPHASDENFAQMGRVSIGISRQLAQGGILSFSLYSDAFRGIPYLEPTALANVAPTVSDDGSDTSLSVSGETNQEYQIKYGDMHNSGVSLALVWVF